MNRSNTEKVCALLGLDPRTTTFVHIEHKNDGSCRMYATIERRLTEKEVAKIDRIEADEADDQPVTRRELRGHPESRRRVGL